MANKIYALFEYYGDGMMCPQNFLCIKYGTPEEILQWLLGEGYLNQILYYGQMMGARGDEKYLDKIRDLNYVNKPTVKTIKQIDIRLPSCCTCRAVSESVHDYPAFLAKFKSMLDEPLTGTVKKGAELDAFVKTLENAGKSAAAYEQLANVIPGRYI